jgi:hypothetical protein
MPQASHLVVVMVVWCAPGTRTAIASLVAVALQGQTSNEAARIKQDMQESGCMSVMQASK